MVKNYQRLREQINYAIQNSELDIGAAYFIVKDIFQSLEQLYYAQINKELSDEVKTESKNTAQDIKKD